MENKNMISEEMIASVINGVATCEIRRLVYNAIESDEELRQVFNCCIYMKVFDEEIENDFHAMHPDLIIEIEPAVETEDTADHNTILNLTPLSANYTGNEEKDKMQ
ncbi:MAG: hypothetical protein LBD80_01185 [Tannerella sp.]|nr:hypothetical protein [Tannerella sp.]